MYIKNWSINSGPEKNSYTFEEYKLYESICIENSHIERIQLDHYLDEGCKCKACSIKRRQYISKIVNGIDVKDKITHIESKNELIHKRVLKVSKINDLINKRCKKIGVKDLNNNMKSLVQKGGKGMDIKI